MLSAGVWRRGARALVAALALLGPVAAATPAAAAAGPARATTTSASATSVGTAAVVTAAVVTAARLPSWCRTGFSICVNKNTRTLYAVRNGRVVKAMSARFGSASHPTRNGRFTVQWKDRDHWSSRYGSSMPFSLFFTGGQAIHYSSNFARVGYDGASHGCINLRSWSGAQWLFDNARVGTHVYVGRW